MSNYFLYFKYDNTESRGYVKNHAFMYVNCRNSYLAMNLSICLPEPTKINKYTFYQIPTQKSSAEQ